MIEIRIATGADVDRVRSVHLCAFPEGEREIVSNLAVALLSEDASPNIISLVAEVKGAIVGHVAYSRAIASSEGGTSIAMSRPKASDGWLPRAIEPTSRRTTRDCFNGPCNFFTL